MSSSLRRVHLVARVQAAKKQTFRQSGRTIRSYVTHFHQPLERKQRGGAGVGELAQANGWSDYFLDVDESRGISPGERWMAALAGAVDRCEAVIFLVSPAWRDSKYCFAEFFEAKKLGKRIFGVIVEPIPLSQLPCLAMLGRPLCANA